MSCEQRHPDDEASGGAVGREYDGGDDDRRGSENRDDVELKGAEQEGYGAGDDDDVRQLAGQRQPGDLRAGGTDHEDRNVAGGDVDQDPAGGERRVDAAVE